ncbi:MAG: hypothetical protein ACFFBI_15370 [Promethearchaeota archaeon]
MEAEKIIPGLFKAIETKEIMITDDFKKIINVLRLSFGGTAPVLGETNPSHETTIDGLCYIGAYSESGEGVMGSAVGARNVVKIILKHN